MNFRKGFSLVETIVYVGILAAFSVFLVNSILLIVKSFNNYKAWQAVNAGAEAAMERMTREIKLADSVAGASIFDASPGRLLLNTINPDTGAATTIEFYVSGTSLMAKEGGQAEAVLTSSNVEAASLIFRQVNASGDLKSRAIRIELELRSKGPRYQKTEKFYDTAILRRSYQ